MERLFRRGATVLVAAMLVGVTFSSPAAAAFSAKSLAISHYQQNNSSWCWATAAQVVIKWYKGASPSQCLLVDLATPGSGCPKQGGTRAQVEALVDGALGQGGTWAYGHLTATQLMTDINANAPIVASIQFHNDPTGGHMVTIYGYETGTAGTFVRFSNGNPIIVGTGTAARKLKLGLVQFGYNSEFSNFNNLINIRD